VLGSGLSGLTVACLLSKVFGEKVLVLERHTKPGGFTHTFRRGEFEWDTGLHYVGKMQPGEFPRLLMDFLTRGEVSWRKMPDPFELFHFPGFKFGQRAGKNNFLADLIAEFPQEAVSLRHYFRALNLAQIWIVLRFSSQVLPIGLAWIPRVTSILFRRWGLMSLGALFLKRVPNQKLAALLAGPSGDYGLEPSRASLAVHSLIVSHYSTGGFYPEGGSASVPEKIIAHLKQNGSEILLGHEANEIILTNGRARGVRAQHQNELKEFHAPKIFSCVGVRKTFSSLLRAPSRISRELTDFPRGISLATIYLGLRSSPAALGLRGENHWLFRSTDFEQMAAEHAGPSLPVIQGCFVSFPSLKDSSAKSHTAEILVPVPYELFADSAQGPWKKRGAEYGDLKEELADRALAFVEERLPGLRALVEFREVSTPLSVEHFSGHARGEVYGLPATREKFGLSNLGPRTHVKGLYVAGADVFAHGIVGAMTSGFCAVSAANSLSGVIRLFRGVFGGAK